MRKDGDKLLVGSGEGIVFIYNADLVKEDEIKVTKTIISDILIR